MNNLDKNPYLHNRWIKKHPEQFYIITPQGVEDPIPIACPVCRTLMRSKDDEDSWNRFKCCYKCQISWAASKFDLWNKGWRPTEEEIQKDINERLPLVINLNLE